MMQLRQDDPEADWTGFDAPEQIPIETGGSWQVHAAPGHTRGLAVTETMAHLDVLVHAGRLSRTEADGVAYYTRG